MIKTKQEKQEFVKSFEKDLKDTKNFCFVNYQGITVKGLEDLRKKLSEVGATFLVIKNRLVLKVLKNLTLDGFDEYLKGPTAIVLEKGDLVKTIKQLSSFSKANNQFKLKAGYLDNKLITIQEISRIASLPPKEQLIASVVNGISSPMVKMLNVLSGTTKKLVIVLKQRELKLQEKK
ncbi:MAG: 50S ribosomal protein L10 [Elusimicrobia bacterium]|nr:50S ribosomal protein L10 [Elusimicrobiota bacterium]